MKRIACLPWVFLFACSASTAIRQDAQPRDKPDVAVGGRNDSGGTAARGGAPGGGAGQGGGQQGAAGQGGTDGEDARQGGGGVGGMGVGGAAGSGPLDATSPDTGGQAQKPDGAPDARGKDTDGSASSGTRYVYVSGSGDAITIFTLNMSTGALSKKRTLSIGRNSSYLAFSPDKKYLYGIGGGRVMALSIDAASGDLTKINEAETRADGATHLRVHPTGKWVQVAHFSSGFVTVLPVGANGGVSNATEMHKPADQAHQVVNDSTGKYLFVPCRSGNIVGQYSFDPATGKLTPNTPHVQAASGAGPRHMSFHPSERWAYVLNEMNGTMTSYRYDATTGKLSDPQSLSMVPQGVAENASAHVEVHPNGKFVYGTNRVHNSVVIFSVNESTGRLALVGHETAGGLIRRPRDFTIDPTGTYLFVANQDSGTVLGFKIDATNGKLAQVGEPVGGLGAPTFVGVLPLP